MGPKWSGASLQGTEIAETEFERDRNSRDRVCTGPKLPRPSLYGTEIAEFVRDRNCRDRVCTGPKLPRPSFFETEIARPSLQDRVCETEMARPKCHVTEIKNGFLPVQKIINKPLLSGCVFVFSHDTT